MAHVCLRVVLALTIFAGAYAFGKEVTFTFRMNDDPQTFDWQGHANFLLSSNIMEGLLDFDENLKPVPVLAKSWSVSKDGKTVKFELKKGVLWEDGVELTANDFYYAWKRVLTPKNAIPTAYYFFDIDNARDFYSGKITDFKKVGVRVVDKYHLEVRLSYPMVFWPIVTAYQAFFPMREQLNSAGKLITLGAFSIESYSPGNEIVLKRNPRYRESKGNVQKVVAKIISSDRTALNLFESKKLDFLSDIDSLDAKVLAGAVRFPQLVTTSLQMNDLAPKIKNRHIRRAIAMSIDKSKIASFLQNVDRPAGSWIPASLLSTDESVGLPYDPVRAKKELAEAGADAKDISPLVFAATDDPSEIKVAEFIRQEVSKNLGLRIDIKTGDYKSTAEFRKGPDVPFHFFDWAADFPDPDNFMGVFMKDSAHNATQWKNDDFDKLIIQARAKANPKKRKALYVRMLKIIQQEEALVIPLVHTSRFALISKSVRGAVISPFLHFPLKDVTVDEK